MKESYITKELLRKVLDCIGLRKGKQLDIETEWTPLDFCYYHLPRFVSNNKKLLIQLGLCSNKNKDITDIAHRLLDQIGMPVQRNGSLLIHGNKHRSYSFDIPNLRQDIIDLSKDLYLRYKDQVKKASITIYNKEEAIKYLQNSNRQPVEWHALTENNELIDFGFVSTIDMAKSILYQKYGIENSN